MKKPKPLSRLTAAAPRPTRAAAVLLASALCVPVYLVLTLVEWAIR